MQLAGARSNREGIGALVTLTISGHKQLRYVHGAAGTVGKSWNVVHFGLGAATVADAIEVRWPSGTVQALPGPIAGDRRMMVTEP